MSFPPRRSSLGSMDVLGSCDAATLSIETRNSKTLRRVKSFSSPEANPETMVRMQWKQKLEGSHCNPGACRPPWSFALRCGFQASLAHLWHGSKQPRHEGVGEQRPSQARNTFMPRAALSCTAMETCVQRNFAIWTPRIKSNHTQLGMA